MRLFAHEMLVFRVRIFAATWTMLNGPHRSKHISSIMMTCIQFLELELHARLLRMTKSMISDSELFDVLSESPCLEVFFKFARMIKKINQIHIVAMVNSYGKLFTNMFA